MSRTFLNWRNWTPLSFFLRYYLFWLLVFFLQRLTFVLYFYGKLKDAAFEEVLQTFFYGLRLDLSMAGYFAAVPLVLWLLQQFITTAFFNTTVKIYTVVLILVNTVIAAGDLGIYANWGVKLNFRAVAMLSHPAEVLESSKSAPLYLLLLIMAVQVLIALVLYRHLPGKLASPDSGVWKQNRLLLSVQTLLIAALVFLSIRGGWQQIPINESDAYFSRYPVVNHTAVNTTWHLTSSLLTNMHAGHENIYRYLPEAKATEIINQLYTGGGTDSTRLVLTRERPNIIFIQLESFTADVIGALGGDSLVTPNINKLISDGLLFTHIYSSGVRTDQGIVALLSGFPAQPQTSIVYEPEKLERIPFLSQALKKEHYYNAFYYGGELGFGRFNSIAHQAGFDRIIGLSDFTNAAMFNKWGADDQSLLDKYVAEMKQPAQPFFSYIITSSSHEPFTVPMPTVISGDSPAQQFKNACYFTDQSLGRFFKAVKQMDWYPNTLFVLVADHGHYLPNNRQFSEPGRYHIPLILYGDVLNTAYRGQKISTIGSQTDIATTLLRQMQISDSAFKWGNDLINPRRESFAFYTFDDGFGWLTAKDTLIFDNRAKKPLQTDARYAIQPSDSILSTGKAYMQMLYSAFLKF